MTKCGIWIENEKNTNTKKFDTKEERTKNAIEIGGRGRKKSNSRLLSPIVTQTENER